MCGWNEPEQVRHNHLHLQVDAALIEELRAGHTSWCKNGPLPRKEQNQTTPSLPRRNMPTLRNPKHEKFAQLVASGMTAQAAFTQAGYPSPSKTRLGCAQQRSSGQENRGVAGREMKRQAEMAAMTRNELVKILAETVRAARARSSEARLGDGLKAAEMLAKMCGWNEPEQVRHDHLHLQVDAALMEELRAGHHAACRAERESVLAFVGWVQCGGGRAAVGRACRVFSDSFLAPRS